MKGIKGAVFVCMACLLTSVVNAQSIRFYKTDLAGAIEMAKKQDKSIFIDTYAKWCIPCKKMEREFTDPALANYFNNNFINVKMDMDTPEGKELYGKYHVVFLPTFLILDKYGNSRIKIDRLLTAKELYNIGKQINEGDSFYSSRSSPPPPKPTVTKPAPRSTASAPFRKPKTTSPTPKTTTVQKKKAVKKPDEKILYVLGEEGKDAPPHVLKKEAYFRMGLMDGSHIPSAKKYLATQKNWSTKENIKFIFDFLYNTGTKEFRYMINHRSEFEAEIGKQQVAETIEILVHNKLNQGYPRPTLDEALTLFSYVDKSNADQNAHSYFLNRLYEENDLQTFRIASAKYLAEVEPKDHQVMYMLSKSYDDNLLRSKQVMTKCTDLIERALELHKKSYEYYHHASYLYFKQRQKRKAMDASNRAISLAKLYKMDYAPTMELVEQIEGL